MEQKNLNSSTIISKLCAYFIIYSVVGCVVETLYGAITMGVVQSRRSFLYGPFLGIYGVAAVVIVLFTQNKNISSFRLFLGGFIFGSIVEYVISFALEAVMGTKWWDYSNNFLNINGRICLLYSVFWGLLTAVLVKKVNPHIDNLLNKLIGKIGANKFKIITYLITFLIFIDCILTCYAQRQFIIRTAVNNNIDIKNKKEIIVEYEKTSQNKTLNNIINTFWGDKKMIKTFPNIKIEDANHNVVYLDKYFPEIKPYYIKLFDKNK